MTAGARAMSSSAARVSAALAASPFSSAELAAADTRSGREVGGPSSVVVAPTRTPRNRVLPDSVFTSGAAAATRK